MKKNDWITKITFFMIGAGAVITLLFLTGATTVSQIGRYQIDCIARGQFTDVYVIDTSTGAVKWVDDKNENVPFEKIKAKRGIFD